MRSFCVRARGLPKTMAPASRPRQYTLVSAIPWCRVDGSLRVGAPGEQKSPLLQVRPRRAESLHPSAGSMPRAARRRDFGDSSTCGSSGIDGEHCSDKPARIATRRQRSRVPNHCHATAQVHSPQRSRGRQQPTLQKQAHGGHCHQEDDQIAADEQIRRQCGEWPAFAMFDETQRRRRERRHAEGEAPVVH
jgi:hypothetical protein